MTVSNVKQTDTERIEALVTAKTKALNILASVAIGITLAAFGFLYSQVYSLNRQVGEVSSTLGGRIEVLTVKLDNLKEDIGRLRTDIAQLEIPRRPVIAPPPR